MFHLEELIYTNPTKESQYWITHYIKTLSKLNIELARMALDKYDADRKAYYDRLIKDRSFEVGDMVLYFKGIIPPKGLQNKLSSSWYGHFQITRVFNDGMMLE